MAPEQTAAERAESTPTDASALDLSGTVAVVTGAARGIGKTIALSLAACGAQLALCDRIEDLLAETAQQIAGYPGGEPLTSVMDVRDPAAVLAFVEAVGQRFGRIDTLVNNAGGGFYAAVLDVSAGGQTALVNENFTSVTHFVRGCVPLMTGGGSIINITSVEAFRAAPGFGIYAAMKAAVEHLSRTLALELAPRRIRVNTIAPDGIPTPGDDGLGETAMQGGREKYAPKLPLGWGNEDDCAGPALFLASDLSRYVTGTTVHVDGGSSAASGWIRRPDGTYEP
jgi:NAD(P)-dependent dehydrogenase (short-subunit alcohol dehydrogenase family)